MVQMQQQSRKNAFSETYPTFICENARTEAEEMLCYCECRRGAGVPIRSARPHGRVRTLEEMG